jgi:hypothetical protein
MQIPPVSEVRQHICKFGTYCWAVLCHYYLLLGGVVVGATVTLFPESYQGVRMSGWIMSGFLIFVATFLAWLSEHQRANQQHQKVLQLEERLRPRITVACGQNVGGCVVPDHNGIWYRVRLDSTGANVSEVEPSIVRLLQDGQQIDLREVLVVQMCMSERLGQTAIMREGRPEYINIAFGANDTQKPPVLTLKHYPGSVGERAYLKPGYRYRLDVVLNCDNTHPSLNFAVNLKLKSNTEVEEFSVI